MPAPRCRSTRNRLGSGLRAQAPQRIPLNARRRIEPDSPPEDWPHRRVIGRIPAAGRVSR
ncbi:hypothetical protein AB0L41_13995 [Amycolatopsis mediterranei]|uniref:hypothetical protein n=1 Tax=Amycolatopsis mediterranei TaxID=33910 RepID=UPI00341966D0